MVNRWPCDIGSADGYGNHGSNLKPLNRKPFLDIITRSSWFPRVSHLLWRMPGGDIAVLGYQQPQRRFIVVARGLAISPFGYEE
jgi:hypothetical protein